MIGKILSSPDGRDFENVINKAISGSEYVDIINLISVETSILEMNSTAFLCPSSASPIVHAMMSWPPYVSPDNTEIRFAVSTFLKEMGMEKCQTIYALFSKNDRKYIHIISSRVSPIDLKPISPNHGWTYKAMQNACKKLSSNSDILSDKTTLQNYNSNDIASYYEFITGRRSNISIAYDLLHDQRFRSWGEFHAFNASYGIRYETRAKGAVFLLGRIYCKASSISIEYSLPKMESKLGLYVPSRSHHDPDLFPKPTPIIEYIDPEIFDDYDLAIHNRVMSIELSKKELKTSQDQESLNLRNIQRKETDNLYARKDKIFDSKRFYDRLQFLRIKHEEENRSLTEKFNVQKEELDDINKDKYPKIPKISEWLAAKGDKILSDLYRYRNNPKMLVQVISYRLDQLMAFKSSFIDEEMTHIISDVMQLHHEEHKKHIHIRQQIMSELEQVLSDPPLPVTITERLFGISRSKIDEYNKNVLQIKQKLFDINILLAKDDNYVLASSDITNARQSLEDKYKNEFPDQYNEEMSLLHILEMIKNKYSIT